MSGPTPGFRQLLDALSVPVTLIDAQGLVVDFNQAFLELAQRHGRQLRREDRIGRHITDFSGTEDDRRRMGEFQRSILLSNQSNKDNDFYLYRYLASEGFLPGYNFPRLPLSAYVPGSRRGGRDGYISRPRFLAISEFGPRSYLYHEGSRYRIERVILPIQPDSSDISTVSAKICPACGYLHPILSGDGLDLCEICGAGLDYAQNNLFRLQNVSTRRVDRIISDEEERVRYGYEIRTALRFASHGSARSVTRAQAVAADPVATLHYGHAATLWRINMGWRRRANAAETGFLLDVERGYWSTNKQDAEDKDSPLASVRTERVVPFVEDRRNCLLVTPEVPISKAFQASLQAALKNAVQAAFQLEEAELAAEPLPDRENRSQILLYEAAEGGAGVLRRLVDDPSAMSLVARTALEICHFDPMTGEDRKHAPNAREDCEAACYDCLMSYSNQADHPLLDRQLIRDYLLQLAQADVKVSPGERPRADHLGELMRQCESELEKRWLRFLEEHSLSLPTHAQRLVTDCGTRPDFWYEDHLSAVYIDGPPHDYPTRAERDKSQTDCMMDLGYTVIRFSHNDDWRETVKRYPSVFGRML